MKIKLEFPAGKMITENAKVKPDLRKGKIILFIDESECFHFQWTPLDGAPEDDFIVFPGEYTFSKVFQTKSRVYILEFQGERFFYWMQDPDTSKDERLCKEVNNILTPEAEQPKLDTLGLAKILESFSKIQKIPDIEEILTPDILKSLSSDLEKRPSLIELLPEGQKTPEKLRESLVSSQLQHAMQVLSEAIRSPGGQAIFASLGLHDGMGSGADPLERFLRALQAKSDIRNNRK